MSAFLVLHTKDEVFGIFEEKKKSWSLPGGKIKPFETAQSALAREIKEECCQFFSAENCKAIIENLSNAKTADVSQSRFFIVKINETIPLNDNFKTKNLLGSRLVSKKKKKVEVKCSLNQPILLKRLQLMAQHVLPKPIENELLILCRDLKSAGTQIVEKAGEKIFDRLVTYSESGIENSRLYSNGLACQGLSSFSRKILFGGTSLIDIDMVNAHPRFMLQMMKKAGFECKCLEKYVNGRKEMIKLLQSYYNSSRRPIKSLFLMISYGGNIENLKKNPEENIASKTFSKAFKNLKDFEVFQAVLKTRGHHEFISSFFKEMKNNVMSLMQRNEYKHVVCCTSALNEVKKKMDKVEAGHGLYFSACSQILQRAENSVLMTLLDFFEKENVFSLIFDGMLVKKSCLTGTSLEEAEKIVKEKTGWEVKLEAEEISYKNELNKLKSFQKSKDSELRRKIRQLMGKAPCKKEKNVHVKTEPGDYFAKFLSIDDIENCYEEKYKYYFHDGFGGKGSKIHFVLKKGCSLSEVDRTPEKFNIL